MVHVTRMLCGCAIAGAAVVGWLSPASAATVDKTVNISSGSLTSSLSLTGSLSVVGSGMKVTLKTGPILGTPISASADITIPPQTVPITLVPNPTPINSPVTGNFVLRGEDNYVAVGPDPNDGGDYQLVPGSDGLFDDGDSANSAMDLIVQSVNVSLINQNFQTNQINLGGTATVDILGITSINFPITLAGLASGNLTAGFDSTGASSEIVGTQDNSTFADGNHPFINPSNPSVNAAPEGVDNLGVSGAFGLPGDLNATLSAGLGGEVTIDLGIFGSVNQSLSGLLDIQEQVNEAFAILGQLTARQLPDASLLHDDMDATIGFDFADLGLGDIFNLPITLVDSQTFQLDFDVPVADLGIFGSPTLDGDFVGTLSYDLNANISLAPPAYTASGTVVDAVNVPEIQTLGLLGLAGIAGLVIRHRRRRTA